MFSTSEFSNKLYSEVLKPDGTVLEDYQDIFKYFNDLGIERYRQINDYVSKSLLNQGASYLVYAEGKGTDSNIFPFDLIPRVIDKKEWERMERGLEQRNRALNTFLRDIYGKQRILKDKTVPADLVLSTREFNKEMMNIRPPGDIFCHICGTDIIRCGPNEFYVLEDNLRNPSGVSYVLSNRNALKKVAAELFRKSQVRSVQNYTDELIKMLKSVAPHGHDNPNFAILTPGSYNSAYFEHALIARRTGIMLVEGSDLFVDNNFVYVKTINGPKRIDVLYRRIDDNFLDPTVFNEKSLIGVPGLMGAYREGNITIVNAPGCGVADDKAVYAFIPEIINYYLGEDPILNNVPTYICSRDKDWNYVKENLKELVVKPVNMSGGYGIVMGNTKSKSELEDLKAKIEKDRRNFIAQPIMSLSLHTTFIEEEGTFEQRHIDLRTYSMLGNNKSFVLPGGLSRVALKKGNLVVNSSQGGGSKDTWVLEN